ncbi:hypothetical protein [Nocardia sp. CA-119907]
MIVVPELFADRLVRMEPAARVWVDGLPELAARYAVQVIAPWAMR